MLGNGPRGPIPVDTRRGGTGLAAPFPYIRGGGHSLCYQNSTVSSVKSLDCPEFGAMIWLS